MSTLHVQLYNKTHKFYKLSKRLLLIYNRFHVTLAVEQISKNTY